jgi:hypothetical protein
MKKIYAKGDKNVKGDEDGMRTFISISHPIISPILIRDSHLFI